jgi:hypothetical protein
VRYGAVPLVTEVLDPDGDLLTGYTDRPTTESFISTLMKELTECEADLMDKPSQDDLLGRISKPMPAALRSRIALYMASPRYGIYTWQQAADTALNFINKYGSQYSLSSAYQNAILVPVHAGNNEVIFWRNDTQAGWADIKNDTPTGEGGNGGLCPSQNLVDMYDMANGLSPFTSIDATGAPVYNADNQPEINTASGYSEQNPYLGREERFYATVLYNGVQWNNRTIAVIKGEADNPIGNANATPTGYYVRKYIPENILPNNHAGTSYRNWIFIRYAEILLNYAEALNEAQGAVPEVFTTLQQIRNRAGLTAALSSRTDLQDTEALRNFIHKERSVELAFEEHRPWDVRRWNVAVEALSRPLYGIEISKNADNQTVYTRKIVQRRVFESKMYLYPLPEAEVWKTGIKNNPEW